MTKNEKVNKITGIYDDTTTSTMLDRWAVTDFIISSSFPSPYSTHLLFSIVDFVYLLEGALKLSCHPPVVFHDLLNVSGLDSMQAFAMQNISFEKFK